MVAKRLSPGARGTLTESGIGWVDESGAAEILLNTIVVSRTGTPGHEPVDHTRWTPAVLSVAEALLCGTRPTVSETATATGLSSGSCTRALRILTDAELLDAASARGRSSARSITDFERLLGAYRTEALAAAAGPRLEVGVLWRDVLEGLEEAGRSWTENSIAWVATGFAAAALEAPFMSSLTSAEVYLDAKTLPELRNAATTAGLTPIEGGRLTISAFPTSASRTLAIQNGEMMVAPWPRLYVDLVSRGIRGEEAAEHLREVLSV